MGIVWWMWLLLAGMVAWVVQAWASGLLNRRYARRLEKPTRGAYERYRPRVAVVIPCKGDEPGLAERLAAWAGQRYEVEIPDASSLPERRSSASAWGGGGEGVRVMVVVESEADPAYAVARGVAGEGGVEVLVAGVAPGNQGQKTHNQLAALAVLGGGEGVPDASSLPERRSSASAWGGVPGSPGVPGVVVFADSDGWVDARFLGRLVGPLGEARNLVSTGYRWLVPGGSGQRREGPRRDGVGFGDAWGWVGALCNASVAVLEVRDAWVHPWGGAMAMRWGTLVDGRLVERLTGSLSDDYQVGEMVRELAQRYQTLRPPPRSGPQRRREGETAGGASGWASGETSGGGGRCYFVAGCVVATPVHFSLGELWSWGRRQYQITRLHAPRLYLHALWITSLNVLGFVATVAALFTPLWPAAVGAVGLHLTADLWRVRWRGRAVRRMFSGGGPPSQRMAFRGQGWVDVLASPLVAGVHLGLILAGGVGRVVRWRGVRYRVKGPQSVTRLS